MFILVIVVSFNEFSNRADVQCRTDVFIYAVVVEDIANISATSILLNCCVGISRGLFVHTNVYICKGTTLKAMVVN